MFTSKLILATSLALAVSGAYADGSDQSLFGWTDAPSTLTREQVRQQLRDAIARGERYIGDGGYLTAEAPVAPKSRAEVRAELRESLRLGLIAKGDGNTPVATAEQERLIAKAGQDAEAKG